MLETIDTKEIKEIVDNIGVFNVIFNKKTIKKTLCENIEKLENYIISIKQKDIEKTLMDLKANYDVLDDNNKKLNESLSDLNLKYNLITKVLSARAENKGLELFRQTFYNDFLEFANADDTLANEAQMTLHLQNVEKELSMIASCPALYKKNIIAIGGGFSAGKSEFISSFINSDIRLPISIEPTTAIPAYVMNDDKEQVIGYNNFGGAVELREIDKDFHLKLSHNFIKSFKFNLKEILPFIIIATNVKCQNICFIDTPGYNPSNHNDDINTAKEFLEEANSFIWLVSLDGNGNMPSGDLNFLSELDLENKKLYVVLNKADLRAKNDLQDIIELVKDSLDDYDIKYEGIQTFSTREDHDDFCVIGKSLDEFLNEHNIESKKYTDIANKLKFVYQSYKKSILNKIEEKKSIQKALKSLELDILKEGIDDMDNKAYSKISELKNTFNTKQEEKNLKLLDNVAEKFKESIQLIFGSENINLDFNEGIKQKTEKSIIQNYTTNTQKEIMQQDNTEKIQLNELTDKEKLLINLENIIKSTKTKRKRMYKIMLEIAKNKILDDEFVAKFRKSKFMFNDKYSFTESELMAELEHFIDKKLKNEISNEYISEFKHNLQKEIEKLGGSSSSWCNPFSCGKI